MFKYIFKTYHNNVKEKNILFELQKILRDSFRNNLSNLILSLVHR